MQPRRLEPGPGRGEAARQRRGLERGGDAGRMVGGHQGRGRLRRQRGGALLGGPGRGEQRLDRRIRLGHAAHDDQRMDAFAARLERRVGRAGAVEGVGGEAPALDLVAALRCALGPARRRGIGLAGLLPFAGAGPMRRDAGRAAPPRPSGARRSAGAAAAAIGTGTEARVVSKIRSWAKAPSRSTCAVSSSRQGSAMSSGCASSTATASSALKSAPASAATRASRSASLDSCAEAALDQRADRRPAAAAGHRPRPLAALARQHQVLQRLEREHRIAAGVAQQRRREPLGAQLGQAERLDQRGELRQVERRQRHGLQALRFLERRAQLSRRRRPASAGRCAKPQCSPESVSDCDQRLQELEAGRRRRNAGRRRRSAGRPCATASARVWPRRRAAAAAAAPRPPAPPPCPSSGSTSASSRVRAGAERERMRRQHRAQQARQHGVGDAGVAGPRLDGDDAGARRRRSRCSRRLLPMPASPTSRKARRSAQACAERLAARARGRSGAAAAAGWPAPSSRRAGSVARAALDRRQQLDRLGRGPGAELVLQALLETLERGDRRGPVAAQVVQAHQAALARARPAGRSRPGAARRPGRGPRRLRSRSAQPRRPARRRTAPASAGAARAATRPAREGRRSRDRRAARRAPACSSLSIRASACRQVGAHRLLQLQPGAAADQRHARRRGAAGRGAGAGWCRPASRRPPARAGSRPGRRGSDRRARPGRAAPRPWPRAGSAARRPPGRARRAGAARARAQPDRRTECGRRRSGAWLARVWCRRQRQATSGPGRAAAPATCRPV